MNENYILGEFKLMINYISKIYKQISELTYYNLDIYHLAGLSKLVHKDFSGRDIQMLSIIDNMNGKATPTIIGNIFHMQQSAVSNRLSLFEKQNLITRQKDLVDTRSTLIYTTKESHPLVMTYNNFVADYIKLLKKSFSLLDIKSIISAVRKFNRMINPDLEKSSKKNDDFISNDLIIIIQDYFYNLDMKYIESQSTNIKQRDLFILTELFLYLKADNNIKAFSEYMEMSYQTIDSKVKRFQSLNYISRNNNDWIFHPNTINLVTGFMEIRIIAYFDTISLFNDKEKKVIHKMFSLFGEHAKQLL